MAVVELACDGDGTLLVHNAPPWGPGPYCST
jgi:hypothetical protein